MSRAISTAQLKSLRKGAKGFLLIDVLPKEMFDLDHIPGARNVPLDAADFVQAVAHHASGSRNRRVILYCAGPGSDASARAAAMLVAGGFTDVLDYAGGLAAWNESTTATPR